MILTERKSVCAGEQKKKTETGETNWNIGQQTKLSHVQNSGPIYFFAALVDAILGMLLRSVAGRVQTFMPHLSHCDSTSVS